jgi:transcriptional regulator with XRE-family HTH domain
MVDFGKKLTELRKARLLTQMELAELLEVQPRLIGRWEQGKGKPQFDYIIKLAEVLEVSLDQMLLGADQQQSAQFDIQNRKLKELCRQVDQLKQEDQNVICHFLDMAVRQDRLKHLVTDPIHAVK